MGENLHEKLLGKYGDVVKEFYEECPFIHLSYLEGGPFLVWNKDGSQITDRPAKSFSIARGEEVPEALGLFPECNPDKFQEGYIIYIQYK